jgi:hypothetical protein
MEPSRKLCLSVEAGDGLEDREECLLYRVVRVVFVAEESAGRRQHAAAILPHHRFERFLVVGLETSNQAVTVSLLAGWIH